MHLPSAGPTRGRLSIPLKSQQAPVRFLFLFIFSGFACTDTDTANKAAGQYLLRAEQIALHGASAPGGAQFYISCAQIEVTGSGSGTPDPTVKLPGAYATDDPGLVINIYYPIVSTGTFPNEKTSNSD
jgi:hypothetical protein